MQLTDELGLAEFSCWQIKHYLDGVEGGPRKAIAGLAEGLPSLHVADAARKRPDPPQPKPERTDWVHVWLKEHGLEQYSDKFLQQALQTREDVLTVSKELDLAALEKLGVDKLGHRQKIIKLLAEL